MTEPNALAPNRAFAGRCAAFGVQPRAARVDDPRFAGALHVYDLGYVVATDLIAAPRVIYRPVHGEFVVITCSEIGFVELDGSAGRIVVTCNDMDDMALTWASGVTLAEVRDQFRGVADIVSLNALRWGEPLVAFYQVGTGGLVQTPVVPWTPGRVIGSYDIVTGAGRVWSSGSGTTGLVEPDWASHFGSQVIDNDLSWNDEGTAPTQGRLRLYAIAGQPVLKIAT